MRKRLAVTILISIVALAAPGAAQSAMGAPGGTPSNMNTGGSHMGTSMNQETFNKLQDYADQAKRLTKDDKAKGKTLEQVLAEDKAAATALVAAMPLSCTVTDALKIAAGPETVDGKTVQTETYETACDNGLGYFLVKQDPAKPYGFSCLAADATKQADIKAGRKPGTVCQLPTSTDMKVMAGNILTKAGIVGCTVKDYRYIGQNAANHTEFDEFACSDGKGYITVSALPGAQIPVHVSTCNESAARGLPCKLSDNGKLPITLNDLLASLGKRGIACDATTDKMHVIGEDSKKRYVVEFVCSQRPKGLVAYLPMEANTAPFEAVDCDAAAKRGTHCTLQAKH